MKKFYIYFFTGFVILSVLLYLSVWWFLGGAAVIAALTIYHFYNARLRAFDSTIEELEIQVEELQVQLDKSLIKEEKATKEARQIRQARQELLSLISHEIRTPMNGIMGMSLLLADSSLNRDQKEYNNTIQKCGQNLLTTVNEILVNDMLNYSKHDRKGKKLEQTDYDLRDLVEEVLGMFASKAGKAGLDLLYDIDEEVPLLLFGDSKRLREVLMNLVENAVKFTQQGEILVCIHTNKTNDNQFTLTFEVKDSGIGIAEDQLSKLFYGIPGKEFHSEDEQSGLGLVICRKQVELLGGKIEVKSKRGTGSVFIFTIPYTGSQKSLHSNQPDSIANLEGKNILVADDNATSRNILAKLLKAWKMLPVVAESGIHALDILGHYSNFDLVITDLHMQQLDGFQLARSIKAKYPGIPVLLLNPSEDNNYKQETGLFSSVIAKPVRYHELKDNIQMVLSKTAEKKPTASDKMESNFSKKHPLNILLAEDNLLNQKIATKILEKLGYSPDVANNGREALEMCSSKKYDIVLMDVQMPEMDGLEATRMMRSTLKKQPVIMAMTANALQGDRDVCIQAGMDDYLSKPINLEELLNHLEKWSLAIKSKENNQG